MIQPLSKICSALAVAVVLAGATVAQQASTSTETGGASVPTSNPEPLTIAALAVGAALAGGSAYRLRKKSK
jgi:hypothetical protein